MEEKSNKFAGRQGALAIITLLFIFASIWKSLPDFFQVLTHSHPSHL